MSALFDELGNIARETGVDQKVQLCPSCRADRWGKRQARKLLVGEGDARTNIVRSDVVLLLHGLEAIAAGDMTQDNNNRRARAFDYGLSVANPWIDLNSFLHDLQLYHAHKKSPESFDSGPVAALCK